MTETDSLLEWMTDHPIITTRDQWAEVLGYSKRTLDNWYSDRTIPMPAMQHLRRIRTSSVAPVPVTDGLRFTLTEWNRIDAARRGLGYPDTTEGRAKFFTDVLTRYAAQLDKPRAVYSPEELMGGRLNEEETPPRKLPA